MKNIILITTLVSISLFAIESRADRFPMGESGDECRAGKEDDCSEGYSCQIVGYSEDLDRPGYEYSSPIYGCVEDEAQQFQRQ